MEKMRFSIVVHIIIIYGNVYGPKSVGVKVFYEKMYTVTSAGMSGGRKWEISCGRMGVQWREPRRR
jgi:hypothetical protein